MSILVCGGAGYIGSHTVAALLERGSDVVVVDSLIKGHKEALRGGKLYVGDIRDADFMDKVFAENDVEAVIDFAAHTEVGESMVDPLEFYDNNIHSVVKLAQAMNRANVKNIVFSSTAAVYGQPEIVPISEECPKSPTSAYGQSKLTVEGLLHWCDKAYGIKYTCLRYFNACGAHVSGEIGEDHSPESHLIPLVLQAALGKRESVSIFGDDYETRDGTCVRDYIHVSDLASAHIKAVDRLIKGGTSEIYNLGSGAGFTVKEIIDKAKQITGIDFKVIIAPRRAGDPAVLIAKSDKACEALGWIKKHDDIEDIIRSAWHWHSSHPNGYNL